MHMQSLPPRHPAARSPLPPVDLLALIGDDTRLQRVAGTGGGEYAGPCPFCGGQDRFHVQPARGRWWCRHCSPSDKWRSAADYVMQRQGCTFAEAADKLRAQYGSLPTLPPPPPRQPASPSGGRETPHAHTPAPVPTARHAPPPTERETHYVYRDEERRPLFRVVRSDGPQGKRFRQERPDPAQAGRWLPGITDVRRVPYRLPELLAAPLETPIYIAEGEKCVHALLAQGHVATCNPGGAGQWRDTYSMHLLNRRVIVLPDNDAPGRAHAYQVAASVATVAADVMVVKLPGLAEHGDIDDWYQAGHHDQELQALIDIAPSWVPSPPAPIRPSLWDCSPVPDFAAHLVRRAALPDEQRGRRMAQAIAGALVAHGVPTAAVHQFLVATAACLDDPAPEWQSAAVSAAVAHARAGGNTSGEDLARLVGDMPAAALIDLAARDAVADQGWPDPIPLDAIEYVPFPLDVLPDWLQAYVRGLATETQTPPDLAAMLALAVLALCAARRVRLHVRPRWDEPLCLYVLVAMRTGSRKSSVFRAVTGPVRRYELAHNRDHTLAIQQGAARRRLLEGRLRRVEREAIDADAAAGGEDRVLALVAELAAIETTHALSLIEGDCTPEALLGALAEQGGSLAMMAPEGGLLTTVTGMQYSDSGIANLDALLAAHAGDALKTLRVGRGQRDIPDPALTIGLTLQPAVLAGLAGRPDFKGRGLLARFLYSLPRDLLGERDVDPPAMADAVSDEYARRIRALLDLPPAQDAPAGGSPGTPGTEGQAPAGCATPRHELALSAEAHDALTAFMRWIEPRLAEDGALAGDDGWAHKLAGHTARIAALLHLASDDPVRALAEPVPAPTMERAIRLAGAYLIPQARAALRSMGADPAMEEARHVLAWIARHQKTSFTRRDVCRDMRKRFPQPGAAERALRFLSDLAYLRRTQPETDRHGRRPDAAYTVNPNTLARIAQGTRNAPHFGSPGQFAPGNGHENDAAWEIVL